MAIFSLVIPVQARIHSAVFTKRYSIGGLVYG